MCHNTFICLLSRYKDIKLTIICCYCQHKNEGIEEIFGLGQGGNKFVLTNHTRSQHVSLKYQYKPQHQWCIHILYAQIPMYENNLNGLNLHIGIPPPPPPPPKTNNPKHVLIKVQFIYRTWGCGGREGIPKWCATTKRQKQ